MPDFYIAKKIITALFLVCALVLFQNCGGMGSSRRVGPSASPEGENPLGVPGENPSDPTTLPDENSGEDPMKVENSGLVFCRNAEDVRDPNCSLKIHVAGDSFTNNSNEWPRVMDNTTAHQVISDGVPGKQLIAIAGDYVADLADDLPRDVAVVAASVNDCVARRSIEDMKTALRQIVNHARLHVKGVIVFKAPPFRNLSIATPERMKICTDYNIWLDTVLETEPGWDQQVVVFDQYTFLDDGTGALQSNYDIGDGIHPNSEAHSDLVDLLIEIIL